MVNDNTHTHTHADVCLLACSFFVSVSGSLLRLPPPFFFFFFFFLPFPGWCVLPCSCPRRCFLGDGRSFHLGFVYGSFLNLHVVAFLLSSSLFFFLLLLFFVGFASRSRDSLTAHGLRHLFHFVFAFALVHLHSFTSRTSILSGTSPSSDSNFSLLLASSQTLFFLLKPKNFVSFFLFPLSSVSYVRSVVSSSLRDVGSFHSLVLFSFLRASLLLFLVSFL